MKESTVKAIAVFIIIAAVLFVVACFTQIALAEDFYVLCKPDGEVNIREKPKLKSPIVACAFFGSRLVSDGKEENGFVHVIDLNAEVDNGWIYKGLLVKDEPIVNEGQAQVFKAGRVACRKYADTKSKVRKWLKAGKNVKVYAISEKWCVTEYGYIMTEFLTLNAKVR